MTDCKQCEYSSKLGDEGEGDYFCICEIENDIVYYSRRQYECENFELNEEFRITKKGW